MNSSSDVDVRNSLIFALSPNIKYILLIRIENSLFNIVYDSIIISKLNYFILHRSPLLPILENKSISVSNYIYLLKIMSRQFLTVEPIVWNLITLLYRIWKWQTQTFLCVQKYVVSPNLLSCFDCVYTK